MEKKQIKISPKELTKKSNPPMYKGKPVLVFALGGLEEIGKNTYCIEYDNDIIIVDAGVKFPNDKLLGINAVIPNYEYLKLPNKKIRGLFITHGHEDHIGGIPYLLTEVPNIPIIYAPRLARALIKAKLKDKKVKTQVPIKEINADTKIKISHFELSYFIVNHSIPDAFGILIKTPNGNIVTTGDYKFDWTPLGEYSEIDKMAKIGELGVDLLMADSTNAEVSGYTMTEKDVIENIDKIFYQTDNRIIITSFASNVHRIKKVVELAEKHKRKIIVLGRSIEKIIKIIREMGHLKINDRYFIKNNDLKNNSKKINELKKTLVICTGSQGEELAALSRISSKSHQYISVQKGDTIIFSSSAIPGNKKNVEVIVNKLTKLGAIIWENSKEFPLHTSGHASREEQKLLFTLLKPKYFMPMHGDYRMLKIHGETAVSVNVQEKDVFICANGDQINLLKDKAWIGERIEANPIYIDGNDTSSGETTSVIRDRDILSKNGLISVIFTIDSKTNKLISGPYIVSRGSFYVKSASKFMSILKKISQDTIKTALQDEKPTFNKIKSSLKSKLSPYIFKVKRRNPLIIPVILNKK